jgi:hypothetical protein
MRRFSVALLSLAILPGCHKDNPFDFEITG